MVSPKYLVFLLLIGLNISCSKINDNEIEQVSEDDLFYGEKVSKIVFSELIEIMSNKDESSSEYDNRLINEFNIVNYNGIYYLYYIAIGKNEKLSDANYNLCMAYSFDGLKWERSCPGALNKDNNVIGKGIIEQSVFLVPDDNYPFRLIGNEVEGGNHQMYLWKSSDGVEFIEKKKMLTDTWHDTQNAITIHNNMLKLYTRVWNPQATNRKVGVCYFNMDGELTSSIVPLSGDYLYDGSPCKLTDKYDLILPTFMNNKEGRSDECHIKTYIIDGCFSKEIPNNMSDIIGKDVKWVNCCPNFVEIGGDKYVGVLTWNWSHDTPMPADGIVKYSLAKISFE